jgi:hypothetical protein
MSLHSQLLRGLLALPVMLLLAIAGVIAPDATPSPQPAPEPPAAEQPLVVDSSLPGTCPHRVVRVLANG